MLYKKYILASALSAALIQGAAHQEAPQPKAGASSRLQLSDCFDRKTATSWGKKRFYFPVILSKVTVMPVESDFFSLFSDSKPKTKKVLTGVVGFVEGDDAEFTEYMAQACSTINFDDIPKMTRCSTFMSIDLVPAKRGFVQGDAARVDRTLNTACYLYAFICSSENREPRESTSGRRFNNIRCPGTLTSALARVEPCHEKDAPFTKKLAALAAYAKLCPESHEALYLQLNKERFNAFLDQEFSDTAN